MKVIVQRVHRAEVSVRDQMVGSISTGLLVLLGIQRGDGVATANWMVDKMLQLRIFSDESGQMNHAISAVDGGLLVVPNFTLYADVQHGNRPGFSEAEEPQKAKEMYNHFLQRMRAQTDLPVESGVFGADMDVSLVNDGPVTLVIEK